MFESVLSLLNASTLMKAKQVSWYWYKCIKLLSNCVGELKVTLLEAENIPPSSSISMFLEELHPKRTPPTLCTSEIQSIFPTLNTAFLFMIDSMYKSLFFEIVTKRQKTKPPIECPIFSIVESNWPTIREIELDKESKTIVRVLFEFKTLDALPLDYRSFNRILPMMEVTTDKEEYMPGEIVHAKVVLRINQLIQVLSGIYCCLVGGESVSWSEKRGLGTSQRYQNYAAVQLQQTLVGEETDFVDDTLLPFGKLVMVRSAQKIRQTAGIYSWDVFFTLPSKLPPTVSDKSFAIQYCVAAFVDNNQIALNPKNTPWSYRYRREQSLNAQQTINIASNIGRIEWEDKLISLFPNLEKHRNGMYTFHFQPSSELSLKLKFNNVIHRRETEVLEIIMTTQDKTNSSQDGIQIEFWEFYTNWAARQSMYRSTISLSERLLSSCQFNLEPLTPLRYEAMAILPITIGHPTVFKESAMAIEISHAIRIKMKNTMPMDIPALVI
eukprot:TRINITY_DN10278_c0_g1_i1.p1 TRINITY_DN10278_c0_g1~~TRINITY_DN10278_c0_g1_i1.p1  ORF type:complete len:530 (-),score=64.60 TRINITY_DN10278_c0_g1_i1:25-1512(-)